MATPQLPLGRPYLPVHDTVALSDVVQRLRQGEEVLGVLDADPGSRPAAGQVEWLSARLTIGELQRLLLPGCDDRCQSRFHEPDAFVAIADLALDSAPTRPASWWEDWNAAMERRHQARPIWFAGAPALQATPDDQRSDQRVESFIGARAFQDARLAIADDRTKDQQNK